MKFTSQVKVLGMRKFNDEIEGKSYNFTKVFVETDLDDSSGNAIGFASSEYPIGDASEFEKYKHLPYPFMADATIEIVTNGKIQKQRMTNLRPLKVAGEK